MVNESGVGIGIVDEIVEGGTRSAAKSLCASRRGRLVDGRLDHGTLPAVLSAHCLYRRRGRIGGLCPHPFSVCHLHPHHDYYRTHFFFLVYHLHRRPFVCHCCPCHCPCHRGSLAVVSPAPRILGGPGIRRVIHGLRRGGSRLCRRDE
jgi:hypothetical protein